MENTIEGLIAVKKDGKVIAVVYNDKGRQIFFSCKEMNQEEVKSLLDSLVTSGEEKGRKEVIENKN